MDLTPLGKCRDLMRNEMLVEAIQLAELQVGDQLREQTHRTTGDASHLIRNLL